MNENLNTYGELLLRIIAHASNYGASDIHIVARSKPALRLNGEIEFLEDMDVLNAEATKGITMYIFEEILHMEFEDICEYDGAFSIQEYGRFRMNIYKTQNSYAIALRFLPLNIRDFHELGIPDSVKRLAYKSNGLVLVTGPTGSGKSTTLAALLDLINRDRNLHIITIEDPIEYVYDHNHSIITQREIGVDSLSFADALRAAMREDPDVILVGEMRDPETIQVAMTAAETGHLVFSTLHTVGASKTIDRIVDSFESGKQNQIAAQLATVLQGIVSQILIPKLDGSGRALACEVMFTTPAIRNLIREKKPHQIASVMQTSQNMDMRSLDNELIKLYRSHVISKDYAFSKAQNSEYIERSIAERR